MFPCLFFTQPENLLLADENDDSKIKVADWGIAQRIKRKSKDNTNRSGTPGYTAPEVIKGEEAGTAVDLWAAGVICYILLGGYPPFDDGDESVLSGEFEFHSPVWDNVSDEAKDMIRRLLTLDPKKRLTAKEALEHEWMASCDKKLAERDLSTTKKKIQNYNARRKFRAAVKAIVMLNRMSHHDHSHHDDDHLDLPVPKPKNVAE